MEKKYWKSTEELNNRNDSNRKADEIPDGKSLLDLIDQEITGKPSSRRNFLKFCGFSFATAAIASSCENPVKKAIPYLNKPEEVIPGMASNYASTYFDGAEYSSIVVKVRDGRPIKIEGNTLSPLTTGGSTARVQASVLGLYDGHARLKHPSKKGHGIDWKILDQEVSDKLEGLKNAGETLVLLTSPVIGPSTRRLISEFIAAYPGSRHIVYEPVSYSGMLEANLESFGQQAIPNYHFDKAGTVVSVGADFLGTWLSPETFTAAYASRRDLTGGEKSISWHLQYEAGLSITGSRADKRVRIRPSGYSALLTALYNELAIRSGAPSLPAVTAHESVTETAGRLWESRGTSIVVCGSNNKDEQILVNAINHLLGNIGQTITFGDAILTKQAVDREMEELAAMLEEEKAGGLILWGVNPVYDYYRPEVFTKGLEKLKMSVILNHAQDETYGFTEYSVPGHHYLESWGDAEPCRGSYSLAQPVIRPLFDTRAPQESLLKWMGRETTWYDYLREYWASEIIGSSDDTWNKVLREGVYQKEQDSAAPSFNAAALTSLAGRVKGADRGEGIELVMYQNIAMGQGHHANNPWLMELPDPVSKVCWDNFAAVSPKTASELGLSKGKMVSVNGLEIPVLIQPGQADGTLSVALGYGHSGFGKVADGVGVNVFPLAVYKDGTRKFSLPDAEVSALARTYELASTQMHHSMEGRPIVRETTLNSYLEKPDSGNEMHEEFEKKHVTLYKEVEFKGHHWGMAVDLNKCTGCSTCVIACQAENNIPVVGKEEVMKYRIMQWMRIDRYYSGDEGNPGVVFQPVMCQHCDNAPCENVCPVSATNHSSEGLNQMSYNRCVGTKYCINNCPYKVRRFNWFRYVTNEKFDYNMNSDLGRMVLNPDVTVRERGVVEKCSFCIQRIQEKKLLAKNENRPLRDGEIKPACMQACPAGAIVFGDLNDPESTISKYFADPRNYHLLEELHTLPSVGYLTLVRNREEEQA